MNEIRLMGHHIKSLRKHREANPKSNRFERWLSDRIYGKGNYDAQSNWAKNLDADNTLVEIVDATNSNWGLNVDSLCEQGCTYYEDCAENVWRTMLRMLKEKPFYFPLLFFYGLFINSDKRTLRKFKLRVGTKYPLDHILNYKPSN